MASVPCPPTSGGPMPPCPFSPWQLEHLAAYTSRPAAAVPEPSGKPLPSGAMEAPRLRICSAVAGCPTPYRVDCAAIAAAKTSAIALSFHIGHSPIGAHLPQLDAVIVITGIYSARYDESFARRSEEHTSELQSRLHLVCRLLLEKKKKNNRETDSELLLGS